jgi:predicted regulator of Ras-like GTPase activity (Roadblock/LC7/MglB family)
MTIPFLTLFRKASGRFLQASPKPSTHRLQGVRVEKPTGQKLSKTVLPNSTRSSAATDPFKAASLAPSINIASGPIPAASSRRGLPPAVALAMQPKVERAISLELSDILEQMPSGYVKSSQAFDSSRRILLKASEIEKGMADGKPTVSLATIYEQAPEIFLQSLPRGETTHVPLPYGKVLEQFNKVQVRSDQVSEQAVPQVETPILQVTIEDKERFGTTMEPPQTSAFPPVKVEPATAKTLSSAEPEPAVSETVARATPTQRGIPLSTPVVPTPKSPRPENPATAGPTRIPFRLPPNGMGASASERVPASSGPSIPTGVAKGPTSARIPFKISAPCDDLRPKLTLVPGVEAPEESTAKPAQSSTANKDKPKIGLSLQAIMQNMPAFQLNGNPETIPTEVRVEFPLSLIEPQLATGRVAIEPKTFQTAMPGNFREIFIVDSSETPVLLPLQEVLKNLPSAALKMRDDQEEIETGAAFETPFLIKAKEDEQRFRVSSAPVSKPSEKPAIETASEETRPDATAPEKIEEVKAKTTEAPNAALEKAASISKEEAEAAKEQTEAELQPSPPLDIKGRKEKNEAKEVLARVNALPGVAGCCLTFADGLGLAGNLPPEAAADGLCAMAPSLLQRIERHMLDTKLGSLTAVTLHCTKSPLTFFMQGNICLTVLQAGGKLASETQDELVNMTKELSRTYSQPETAHVDH